MEKNTKMLKSDNLAHLPSEILAEILKWSALNGKRNFYSKHSKCILSKPFVYETFTRQLNNIKKFLLLNKYYGQFFKPNIQNLFKQPDFIEDWLDALGKCINEIEDNSEVSLGEYDEVDWNEFSIRMIWNEKKLQRTQYFQQLYSLKKLYRLWFAASEIDLKNYPDKFYLIHAYCTNDVKTLNLPKLEKSLQSKHLSYGLYGALTKTLDIISNVNANKDYELATQNLRAVNLAGINLENCSLTSVNLMACDLSFANLRSARLTDCTTDHIILDQADLSHSDLTKIHLRSAKLAGANLEGTNLSEAFLAESNLSGLNLQGANLQQANLRAANLSYANLSSANLQSANLKKTNFHEANLTNANVNNTVLHEAQLANLNHRLGKK